MFTKNEQQGNMKKLSDLGEDERTKISNEIDSLSRQYSVNSHYDFGGIKIDMGLCTSCAQLLYTKTEYGTTFAFCDRWGSRLNGVDLVSECTGFSRNGGMSLWDMKEIAVLIDIPKRKIGIV